MCSGPKIWRTHKESDIYSFILLFKQPLVNLDCAYKTVSSIFSFIFLWDYTYIWDSEDLLTAYMLFVTKIMIFIYYLLGSHYSTFQFFFPGWATLLLYRHSRRSKHSLFVAKNRPGSTLMKATLHFSTCLH